MARRLLMGNEAFAHAALEAGVGLVAGYPGTPSSELVETVARQRAKGSAHGVHVEWSTNEKAALEVAAAASMSGVRALFTCKQVGLNVASDALMSLNYVGVRGGLVLFVADDPGPISSQTEQDTRRFAEFAKVPVLDPANPEQGFVMMKAAFDLSEKYRTPVIVRPTTRIDHASTFFDVEEETFSRPPLPPDGEANRFGVGISQGFVRNPERWVIFPKRSYQAHGEINERLERISYTFSYDDTFAEFNPFYISGKKIPFSAIDSQDPQSCEERSAKLGIVACGCSASYALEALTVIRKESKRANVEMPPYKFVQIGTPYPAPKRVITRFFKGLSDILVLEELDSVVEEELLKVAGKSFLAPTIHGKLTGEASTRGENSTEDAVMRIARFFDNYEKVSEENAPYTSMVDDAKAQSNVPDNPVAARRAALQKRVSFSSLLERSMGPHALCEYGKELPPRPPVLCAGCPHRGSFYAVKKALGQIGVLRDEAVFCGDIGCYTLGNAEPLDAVDTCLCMGAGITMAQGFAATNPTKKCIAFVGDSTFFASGLTGIVNAVYNNHDITIVVLDNSTTAMTGMQPHPGTGVTLMGTQSAPIDIESMLRAIGVKTIHVANPLNRGHAEDACIKALKTPGPSAIIFKSPCIWLKNNDRVARVNVHKCTGCKKCITEIGCPAISFDLDARGAKSGKRGQAAIDPSLCNGCSLCAQICPFQAIRIYKREELEELDKVRLLDPNDDAARMAFGSAPEGNGVEFASNGQDNAETEDRSEPDGCDGQASQDGWGGQGGYDVGDVGDGHSDRDSHNGHDDPSFDSDGGDMQSDDHDNERDSGESSSVFGGELRLDFLLGDDDL